MITITTARTSSLYTTKNSVGWAKERFLRRAHQNQRYLVDTSQNTAFCPPYTNAYDFCRVQSLGTSPFFKNLLMLLKYTHAIILLTQEK